MMKLVVHLKAFIAGFLATVVFHQGTVLVCNMLGLIDRAPFNMDPTAPFGVPSLISISFFGGLWGIVIWHFVKNDSGAMFWLKSFLFGGVALTAVAILIVSPIKGFGVSFDVARWAFGIIFNGMWGIGNSAFARLLKA